MYETRLDPHKSIHDAVDAIRSTTDASLLLSHKTLVEVLNILEPHLRSETFNELSRICSSYEPDINNCFDRRQLDEICNNLSHVFSSKHQQHTSTEDDEMLCAYVKQFAKIARKTDNRIIYDIVRHHDFEWITQLLTAIEMDQDDSVRHACIDAVDAIFSDGCEPLRQMLIESRLPILLVQITSRPFAEMTPKQKQVAEDCIVLLSKLYSFDIPPNFEHQSYLNYEYFNHLYANIDQIESSSHIFNICVNLNFLLDTNGLSTTSILQPINDNPMICSKFGLIAICEINLNANQRRLHFLQSLIILGKSVLEDMFYSNDLMVLARVLARNYFDQSDKTISRLCHDCLQGFADLELIRIDTDSLVQDALSDC